MTTLLLRGGRLFDPARGLDDQGDVLVRDGVIARLGGRVEPPADARVLELEGKLVLPGLTDMHVHLREPGFEYKEDIETGSAAAAAGGFTRVGAMPNTDPPVDCRPVVDFVLRRASAAGLCRVMPFGTMTLRREGKALSRMGELAQAGVRAVSDDGDAVADAGLMRRVLEYARTFDLLCIQHCEDANLSRRAPMNEGVASARAGLAGQPAAAEAAILSRDLYLVQLIGARYHAAHVSTAESVELVRRARESGLPVSAEVTIHHLYFTDEACLSYDPNTKVNPPFRTEQDRKALLAALEEGVIQVVVSDHAPHSRVEKDVEYDDAAFGIIGLETQVPLGLELVRRGELKLETLVRAWTEGPARILGLDYHGLQEGAPADLAVVDEDFEWTVTEEELRSRSFNTPLAGRTLRGRAVLTLLAGRVVWDLLREH